MNRHHKLPGLPSMDRRRWLMHSGSGLAGALGAGTLGNLLLGARPAHAADYKALVCIFLYGGNDGMNTIIPTDSARYTQYAGIRSKLAIPASSLAPLSGIDFGLHPSLTALKAVWDEGKLAPVFNLGPLFKPLTKAQFRAEPNSSEILPDNLYSHSDQQVLWETGSANSLERTGWGGRASATLNTANPVISVSGSTRFGLSGTVSPLVLPGSPGDSFGANGLQAKDMKYGSNAARKAALDLLYSQGQDTLLADAFATAQRNAFSVSDRLGSLIAVKPGGEGANAAIDAAFAPLISGSDKKIATSMGRQLYQIAKLVAGNLTVQGNRQIFFAQMGGFDTHGNQAITGSTTEGEHARLLKELGDAMAAFHGALKGLGMADAVTTFTQSDFGRTFTPNNSMGTDHAWGNHHLVMGGAVKGGKSYGNYPELSLGGPNDVGVNSWELQGRWIPTTSVDQYAATMLSWFGASDSQLGQILPNLHNFATPKLGFL